MGHKNRRADAVERTTISAVYIVKDEEKLLASSLESITWADEIVVYDTGSVDSTREIARRYTPKVIEGYWDEDFGAARNRAQAHATGDWIIAIDADQRFEGSARIVRKQLSRSKHPAMLITVFNEGETQSRAGQELVINWVYRRDLCRFEGALHEQLVTADGQVAKGTLLPEARLLHSGFTRDSFDERDKAERNLRVARQAVEAAEARGDLREAANMRVHVVRTLLASGDREQVRTELETAWQPELLDVGMIQQLADRGLGLAVEESNVDGAHQWLDRLASVVPEGPELNIARARVAGLDRDFDTMVELIDTVPERAHTSMGFELRRVRLAMLEASALHAAGRSEQALPVVRRALVAEEGEIEPIRLIAMFGAEPVYALLDVVGARHWRSWTLSAAASSSRIGLDLLAEMERRRTGDVEAIVCACTLSSVMSFAEAAEWSAKLRSLGLDEGCPLVALAADPERAPRDRALAAALAQSAFDDGRALPLLDAALRQVAPDQEPALLDELAVVAPGLVSLA